MILLLDNYDSFVHNLARYLRELGEEVEVRRNDRVTVEEVRALAPTHLVISPGPCTPAEAGVCNRLLRELGAEIPVLGVCLGHQCVGAAFGAQVVRARRPMHGKTSRIRHDGEGLFTGLPDPLTATRYHSLVVERSSLPDELEVIAWTEEEDGGEVMGLRHRGRPVWGVQFHPEAVLTEHGHALLANFLALGRGQEPDPRRDEAPPRELEGAATGTGGPPGAA
jgi:anthranilate synthase component 2